MSAWAGISGMLKNSGKAKAATGIYGLILYFAAFGANPRTKLVDVTSDLATDFAGDARLLAELNAYVGCADTKANAVVRTQATIASADIGALIDAALPSAPGGAELLVFDLAANAAFLAALKVELAARAANKQRYRALCRWRNALVAALVGVPAATHSAGAKTSIPLANHGLEPGDEVIIYGSTNYDGAHILDVGTDANNLVIPVAYVAEVFAAGATLEESPESYLADFVEKTAAFSDPRIHLVLPTTQVGHLGSVAGVASACDSVADEPGAVELFPLDTALTPVDEVWLGTKLAVIKALAAARAIVIRRHAEDPTHVYINVAHSLYGPQDDQKSLPMGRLADKILRLVEFYGFPAVNSRKYPATEAGGKAIAQLCGQGDADLKRFDGVESITRTAVWNSQAGGWDVAVEAYAPAYGRVINQTVTLIPQN